MIEIFDVEKFNPLKIVHDSIVSTFELHDNMFIMTFDRVDLESETMEIINIEKKLRATYILNEAFKDWDRLNCSVRNIDYRKNIKKNIIKYFTLKEMIEKLNSHNKTLSLQAQYYRKGYCLVCAEGYSNGTSEAGNNYYIQLMVDRIIYEWS